MAVAIERRKLRCLPTSHPTRHVLSIGSFDGVHAGHVALMRHARSLADAGPGGRVLVLAFDPHPSSVIRPGTEPARLTTFAHRRELLLAAGADDVQPLAPSAELLAMPPEAFISQTVSRFAPTWFVEGQDFCFGKGRAGNVETLRRLGGDHDYQVAVLAPVDVTLSDHSVVPASSTMVRWLIARGRVADAARVLGRPYQIRGVVTRGDQRGRTIGVPTANLATEQLLPADGVYAGIGTLPDGRRVGAAVNVGTRPTFDGVGRRLEAHLLDASDPVSVGGEPRITGLPDYGWPLRIDLIGWIRDDLRFGGIEALVAQMRRDIERVRARLG